MAVTDGARGWHKGIELTAKRIRDHAAKHGVKISHEQARKRVVEARVKAERNT